MKRRILAGSLTAAFAVSALGGPALAGQPGDPGCFGQDRAAILQGPAFIGDAATPGASGWGALAGDRAATNGELNRAYKASCGGDPSTAA